MTSPLRDGRLKRDRMVSSVPTCARSAPVIFWAKGCRPAFCGLKPFPEARFAGGVLTPQQ